MEASISYRPHPKGARVNPSSPRAWATDDRSGFIVNHDSLRWQHEWAGNALINKHLLVRPQSLDKPQPQFRALVLPPDPQPIFNARVEPYAREESPHQFLLEGSSQSIILMENISQKAVETLQLLMEMS